ncbi:MAG: 3'(2'),5'-bisphosphate nucleotidase CysQ, partial [Pseudolabrys sp.]
MTSGSEILPAKAAELLDDLTAIVARACVEIRAVSPSAMAQWIKADGSPVTAADEASEAALLQGVARLLPAVPVVSEESPVTENRFDESFLL